MNFLFLALSWQTATLLVSLKLWKTLCGSAEGGVRKLTQFMWINCKWHHLLVSYTIAHLKSRLFRSSLFFSSTKNCSGQNSWTWSRILITCIISNWKELISLFLCLSLILISNLYLSLPVDDAREYTFLIQDLFI